MTVTVKISPVHKTVRVNLPQAKAFALFTDGIDRWWPRTHHPGGSSMTAAVLEPFAGGRWYHTCEDGSEYQFGHVLDWHPPERLTLIWQNDCAGHGDRNVPMEVHISFVAEGVASTRVELEHTHIERLGDKAEDFREGVNGGWTIVLESFVHVADGGVI